MLDLNRMNNSFCLINEQDLTLGDQFLDQYLSEYILLRHLADRFFLENYYCFNNTQLSRIRATLNTTGVGKTQSFYHLVSLYKLDYYKLFLQSHLSENLKEQLVMDLKEGIVKKKTLFYLRNMATLANLGRVDLEEKLLVIVDTVYTEVKAMERHTLLYFYKEVIPNSVGILLSQNAVRRTVHLFDELGPITEYNEEYSEMYFKSAVKPKVKGSVYAQYQRIDWGEAKTLWKDLIMNDSSIWLEHVK